MKHDVDLFGNPTRPGKGARGRPPYERTVGDENRVKLGLALGWSAERIANGIGVSLATLKRYFRAELKERDEMRDRLDLARLHKTAELAGLGGEQGKGNVGSLRLLDSLLEKNDNAVLGRRFSGSTGRSGGRGAPKGGAGEGEKLGKKEQQLRDARAVGGEGSEWGDDLFPGGRAVINPSEKMN